MVILGIGAVAYLFMGEERKANIFLKVYLGFANLWIGIVFFIVLADKFPTPLKQIQGSLFIAIGVLLLLDIFIKKITFGLPKKRIGYVSMICALLVVNSYPLIGMISNHEFSEWIFPGTLPCPTTATVLVLLIFARKKASRLLFILLLIWAIPFPPLIQIPKYGVYEDSILLVSGLVGLIILIKEFNMARIEKNNLSSSGEQ